MQTISQSLSRLTDEHPSLLQIDSPGHIFYRRAQFDKSAFEFIERAEIVDGDSQLDKADADSLAVSRHGRWMLLLRSEEHPAHVDKRFESGHRFRR